jgi:hypothetical protein
MTFPPRHERIALPGATTADFGAVACRSIEPRALHWQVRRSPWAGRPSPAAEFPLIARRGDRRPTRAAKGVHLRFHRCFRLAVAARWLT